MEEFSIKRLFIENTSFFVTLFCLFFLFFFSTLPASSFSDARHIVSELLLYQLLMCAAATAIDLFALESNGIFSAHSLATAYDLIIVLAMTFMYCYLSEALSSSMYEIGGIFYGMAWYQLPAKKQVLIRLPIQQSQREFRLEGVGLVDCSLDVFGKVSG